MADEIKVVETKTTDAPLQTDPVKEELRKEKERNAYSEKEKAEYNLKKQAEKFKELGGDPTSIIGTKEEDSSEIPEWFKKEKAKENKTTSLTLADSLSDADERALTKEYLSKRIVPSDNPESDFRLALSAVRSLKNGQILEDINRRSNPKYTASGGSSNTSIEDKFEPTKEEQYMMTNFKISKDKILEARRKEQEKRK